ncbi:MAG: NAD(P)-binding protein [Chloroflexi bacterium]|nr:NAD(P)-binding protein [Chloroflexota bacterium]
MQKEAIRIAGAGLAGLTAAINLARYGYPVEVFEKNENSGANRSVDWDGIENWTTEEDIVGLFQRWGIEICFNLRSTLDFEVYDRNGACYPVSTERPFFYLVERGAQAGSLEQSLKQQALDLGVEIHYSQERSRSEVEIWATGMQNIGFFLDVGMTFRTRHPDLVMVLADAQTAPRAYTFLVIADGLAALSVVLTRDFRQARAHLNQAVESFRRILPLEMDDMQITSGFSGMPHALGQSITHPIRVGEAAGFQDYLLGFGIRHALSSGYLAAQAIHDGVDYEKLVNQEIRPLVRTSVVNRMLYDLAGDRLYRPLIRWFTSSSNLSGLTRRWYRNRSLQGMLWPVAFKRYADGAADGEASEIIH